ncbi:hypothetical protein AM370_17090 [Serratia marcescens]|uniref:UvrD-helicase domain-containing protein n=1 Tax=Serratia marcescens TaxID=615 RepID=UPI000D3E432F|nr:UvrD-helicase domain-containing protein [Serratia marcescens]AWC90561.1 hypothetical protein AM370_17090 [Serratia marcescens]AWS68610.1 hypothetical protein AM378_09425 [Serratia marcescens]
MNKLIVASAGAGKTTFVVSDALKKSDEGAIVLITTFTEACKDEIFKKIITERKCIPANIHVYTWFSLLIQHGVRPYQGKLFQFDVKGMILCNGRSGLRYKNKAGIPVYWGEGGHFKNHYFDGENRVYSDKLAKLVIRCNESSGGLVFSRLARCFTDVYVDEVQDLACYDLEILSEMFSSGANITLVGDPRQATYSTTSGRKNERYKKANIVNFFLDKDMGVEVDNKTLVENHRCHKEICEFSNAVYPQDKFPDYHPAISHVNGGAEHEGVFALSSKDVLDYLEKFQAVQLRDSIKTKVNEEYLVYNFGKSKGLTFDRVVIYPSAPMVNWFKDRNFDLAQAARAKLYVALTRPRKSVAIVFEPKVIALLKDLKIYKKEDGY